MNGKILSIMFGLISTFLLGMVALNAALYGVIIPILIAVLALIGTITLFFFRKTGGLIMLLCLVVSLLTKGALLSRWIMVAIYGALGLSALFAFIHKEE